jgi:hypothetical protein
MVVVADDLNSVVFLWNAKLDISMLNVASSVVLG